MTFRETWDQWDLKYKWNSEPKTLSQELRQTWQMKAEAAKI